MTAPAPKRASVWVRWRVAAALRRYDRGDVTGALRVLRWARVFAPRSAELMFWIGMTTRETVEEDDIEFARRWVRRAAMTARGDAGLLVRCSSAMVGMAAVNEIEPWVEQAMATAPTSFALADELVWLTGCVSWANGDFERAEELLREAFYLLPNSDGVQLADTYIELGRNDRALATVEEGLRRGGKHPALFSMREWLRAGAD